MRCALRIALGLTVLVAGGCVRSGQTGSPAEERRPRYETPGRFSPDVPGGNTGNPGEGPDLGSNRPTYYAKGSETLGLLPGGQLVTAASQRGVLVYDVAEPARPRLIATVPVRGQIHQIELDEDGSGATVMATEALDYDEPRVPEEPLATVMLRLIRVDLSDPSAPSRAAQLDLPDDAWLFIRRGEHYFVLSELYDTMAIRCGEGSNPAIGEWGRGTRAMRVSDYERVGGDFALRSSLELPADWSFALFADDALFVPDGYYSRPEQGRGSSVSWADFSSGGLVERGPIEVEGRLAAVARGDGVLVTLSELFSGSGQSTVLQTWSLDAQGSATLRGRLTLDAEQRTLQLLPGANRLLVAGGEGVLVDLNDLASPRVAFTFGPEVERFEPLEQGTLALGRSGSGHLVASLWSLDQSLPQQRARFQSSWPWNKTEPGQENYGIDREHGLLLVPSTLGNSELSPTLGVIDIAAGALREHGSYVLQKSALRPETDGTLAYSWSYEGLEVVPLVPGARETEPSSGYAPFYEPNSLAQVELADGRSVQLRERERDGRYLLEVLDATGGVASTLELEHMADGLVAFGERVAVLGFRWDSECMYLEPQPDPGSTRFDRCAPYRRRGLSVVDVAGEPAVVESFTLDSNLDFEPIDGVTADTNWTGYVRLEDDRLLFLVTRYLRCESQASCDAIDTPAYQSMSSPGCNPQTQNCAELPRVEIHTSGAKPSLMLYALEGVESEPHLQLKLELPGRFDPPSETSTLDIGWFVLPGRGGFALPREEPQYNADGNSIYNEHEDAIVRFYLDRVLIGQDGGLRALPSVNTPGRPVAWDGDNVYSVEPDYDSRGRVFVRARRSELRADGAHIAESVEIGPGFLDARSVGDQMVVLRGPADPCAADARTALFTIALDPGRMEKSDVIDLPTRAWGFQYGPTVDSDGLLIVRGGTIGSAHLEVDLADRVQPSLVRYTTAPVR